MRLLNPQEHRASVEKEDLQGQNKLRDLLSAIDEANRMLNAIRDRSVADRAQLSLEHDEFMKEKTIEREALETEVVELESRKQEALRPIDERKLLADNRIAQAEKKELELAESTHSLAESIQQLEVMSDKLLKESQDLLRETDLLKECEQHLEERESQFASMMTYKEVNLRKHEEKTRALLEELDQKSKQ